MCELAADFSAMRERGWHWLMQACRRSCRAKLVRCTYLITCKSERKKSVYRKPLEYDGIFTAKQLTNTALTTVASVPAAEIDCFGFTTGAPLLALRLGYLLFLQFSAGRHG